MFLKNATLKKELAEVVPPELQVRPPAVADFAREFFPYFFHIKFRLCMQSLIK